MAEKILMTALSPTMEEGTIVSWRKKEGEAVAGGDVLCEVETDKATMDYESAAEGILLKILVPEGASARIGEPIAIVGQKGEDIGAILTETAPAASAPAAPAAATAQVPPAAPAAAARTAVEPTIPAQPAARALPREGYSRPAAAQRPEEPAQAPAGPVQAGRLPGGVRASPLARSLAGERGVDLKSLQGSGPGGRIVMRDVESAAAAGAAGPAAPEALAGTAEPSPAARAAPAVAAAPGPAARAAPAAAALEEKRFRVSGKRRVIAQRLAQSKFSAPHYYLRIDVEMDSLMEARRRLNAEAAARVSLNAFLVKFAAEALKRHPALNSSWEGETILQHGSIDVGLAVALPDGLVAPVVRGCGGKGILAIDGELAALIEKAQAGRLTPEEMNGATFTVSNLGSYGILDFTAIINPPGSAILAVGRIQKVPVVTGDEEIDIRSKMILTLSCDHRVVDGAVGAAFLADLKRMLEEPIRILY